MPRGISYSSCFAAAQRKLKALLNYVLMNDLQDFGRWSNSWEMSGEQVLRVSHATDEVEILWYQLIIAVHDEHMVDRECDVVLILKEAKRMLARLEKQFREFQLTFYREVLDYQVFFLLIGEAPIKLSRCH